jgi:hypothetical protein
MAVEKQTRRNPGAWYGRACAGALLMAVAACAMAGGCSSGDPNAKVSDEEGEAVLKRIREHPASPDDLTVGEKKWLRDYLAGQRGR